MPHGYRRLLSLANRTYGRASEYLELTDAFAANPDPAQLVTALAINEAIDRIYGTRARLLKRHVYRSGYWPFPVGFDTLSRIWR